MLTWASKQTLHPSTLYDAPVAFFLNTKLACSDACFRSTGPKVFAAPKAPVAVTLMVFSTVLERLDIDPHQAMLVD